MKVCDTATLFQLDEEAQYLRLSRQVDLDALGVDPNGKHILERFPIFQPFARCKVLIKIIGTTKPVETIMDVNDSSYDALEDATGMLKALKRKDDAIKVTRSLDRIIRETT